MTDGMPREFRRKLPSVSSARRDLLWRMSEAPVTVQFLEAEYAARWGVAVEPRMLERVVRELDGLGRATVERLLDEHELVSDQLPNPTALLRLWASLQLDPPSLNQAIARVREVIGDELPRRGDLEAARRAAAARLAGDHPVIAELASWPEIPPASFDRGEKALWQGRYQRAVTEAENGLIRRARRSLAA